MDREAIDVLRADIAELSRKLDAHDAYAREPAEVRLAELMRSDWFKQCTDQCDRYLRALNPQSKSFLDKFAAEVPPRALLPLFAAANDSPHVATLQPLFEAIVDAMPAASKDALFELLRAELERKP